MKAFLLIVLFSQICFSQYRFTPQKEEIGKKGMYTLSQKGIPIHKDYEAIFDLYKDKELSKDASGKYYVLNQEQPSFKIYVPPTYLPSRPAGIIILAISSCIATDEELNEAMEYCKFFAEKRNFICIGVETKNPNFEQIRYEYSPHLYEYALLIRRAVDIIKERYKTEFGRIVTFTNSETKSLFLASISCPSTFRYNSFIGLPYIIEGSKAKKNTFHFYLPFNFKDKKSISVQRALNLFKKQKYNSAEFVNAQFIEFVFKNIITNPKDQTGKKVFDNQYDLMIEALDGIDPKFTNSKRFLLAAKEAEKNNNKAKAFTYYKQASQYGFKKAFRKVKELQSELDEHSRHLAEYHKAKDYPGAYKLILKINKDFGQKSNRLSNTLYLQYSKNKHIIAEIKASAKLERELLNLSNGLSDKNTIKSLCQQIVANFPGSRTAIKAAQVIEDLD